MDLAGFEMLLSPPGQRLLAAAMVAYDEADLLGTNARLRGLDGGYPPDLVAAALTQVGLRRAAAVKFGRDAERMYLTATGLEQATHPLVAAHRAGRATAVTTGAFLDLGCGIGSDLLSFARAGCAVTGVDSDELTAAVAAANLAGARLPGSVRRGRAEDTERTGFDIVFADPARRRGGGRLFDPRTFSPGWDFVLALLAEAGGRGTPRTTVVKLAPGLDHSLVPTDVEAEWVSLDGDLKEAVLWSPTPSDGSSDRRARRRATLVSMRRTTVSMSDLDAPRGDPSVAAPGAYVYEPDAAVIRAHLVSSVAAQVHGWLLDPHIAYVSSDEAVLTPFARGFRVLESLPYKEKPLREALRTRGVGTLTIKKRGVAVTPEDLRRRLALRGAEQATIILTRTPGSAAALLVEPVE